MVDRSWYLNFRRLECTLSSYWLSTMIYEPSTNKLYICLYIMTPAQVNTKWKELQERLAEYFDTDTPDIKVMLFLIGVQELGQGPKKFSKRQKEELMHIANCKLFSMMGFYELEGLDQDGWPHWKLIDKIPNYTILEQELIMKSLIIDYFAELS